MISEGLAKVDLSLSRLSQDAVIKDAKKNIGQTIDEGADEGATGGDGDEDFQLEPELVEMPIILRGPGAYAMHLLDEANCNQEQRDVVSLIAAMLQRRWDSLSLEQRSAAVEQHGLPNDARVDNCSLLLLGGGGCGKSFLLKKVVEPLMAAYFPRSRGLLILCQSNAGARLVLGRTLHSALGLTPASNLQTQALRPLGDNLLRLQKLFEPLGGLAIDETPMAPGKLVHAAALRITCARAPRSSLEISSDACLWGSFWATSFSSRPCRRKTRF